MQEEARVLIKLELCKWDSFMLIRSSFEALKSESEALLACCLTRTLFHIHQQLLVVD